VNTVTASFNTIMGQMTEMSQRKENPDYSSQILNNINSIKCFLWNWIFWPIYGMRIWKLGTLCSLVEAKQITFIFGMESKDVYWEQTWVQKVHQMKKWKLMP